ncbi:MAG: glycosyl transferase [Clostridia bacterium]|nr:glycosyl transferase [Clostridia bacterium]
MKIVEKIHKLRKEVIRKIKAFYRDFFTVDGVYTSLLPDKVYLKKLYKKKIGKELNLKNPTLFNEKLNWLKLYDRRPEYTMMVDKYRVREYIKETIGEEYLVPLLGVYDKVEDIDFDSLPNEFVLKCNHDSEVVICRDKENNDFQCKKGKINSIEEVKAYLKKRMGINFYKASREWPYKNVKRKIVCEKFMSDGKNADLTDYKFYCFNGKPQIMYVANIKDSELYIDYFDMNFKHLSISRYDHANLPGDNIFIVPEKFEEMKLIAAKLSCDIPQVRIDLYSICGEIYFGEITFFTAGGFLIFSPNEWDKILGDYIELPKKKFRLR